jgi:hypothetical protein
VVEVDTLTKNCDYLASKYNNEQQNIEFAEISRVIAECAQILLSRSGDRVTDRQVWKRLLTCIYAGSFEADAESSQLWSKLWSETALFSSGMGTKQAALHSILPEVLSTVQRYLRDLYWNRRVQGLSILKDIALSLDPKSFADLLADVMVTSLRLIPGYPSIHPSIHSK